MIYVTKQGDMWDSIAYEQLGSVSFTDKLITMNKEYREIFVFPAGIRLVLPDAGVETLSTLPPWKQVMG